jgi:hypothetical protein
VVASVVRLVTFVEIRDEGDGAPDPRRISLSARQEAVLADGSRVVLLDDRGWTEWLRVVGGREPSFDIWANEMPEQIERTARAVVGPDEPFEGRTREEMAAGHWETLARKLREQGVEVETAGLRGLPHDVELSDRVLARVGAPRRDAR